MATKAELEGDLKALKELREKERLAYMKLLEENKKLKQDLAQGAPTYIMLEVAQRNFCIGKKVVGTKDQYSFLATCRNRNQSERLLEAVNDKSL